MDGDETEEPTLQRQRQAIFLPFPAKKSRHKPQKNSDGRKMKVSNDTT